MSNTPTYLNIAKFAQIAYAEREANELAFKGSFTTPQYSKILSLTIQAIQARYNKLPNDPTLQPTGDFMYALSGGVNTTPNSVTSTFMFIVQPNDNTVTVGLSVTFNSLAVNGVAPITYQWQKNGVNIGGATSANLTINPVALSDAGSYDVIATDATGLSITSRIANLVVNAAALVASWYWNASVDPYPALAGGTDNLTYLGTVNFTTGSPIIISWPSGSANNTYKVVRYPIGEGAKVHFFNNDLNQGSIPGVAYHEIVTIGSFLYIISKGDSIFTPFIVTYT